MPRSAAPCTMRAPFGILGQNGKALDTRRDFPPLCFGVQL